MTEKNSIEWLKSSILNSLEQSGLIKHENIANFINQFFSQYTNDLITLFDTYNEIFLSKMELDIRKEIIQLMEKFIKAKLEPISEIISPNHFKQFQKPLIISSKTQIELFMSQPFLEKSITGSISSDTYKSLFTSIKNFCINYQQKLHHTRFLSTMKNIEKLEMSEYKNTKGQFSKEFKPNSKLTADFQPLIKTKHDANKLYQIPPSTKIPSEFILDTKDSKIRQSLFYKNPKTTTVPSKPFSFHVNNKRV